MVNTESHWAPPTREPLLISASKLADILDVPVWKAHEIAWALDRRFYGEGQRRYRITMASVKEYLELKEMGLPAKEIMRADRYPLRYDQKPFGGLTPRSAAYWQRKRGRR